MLILTPDNLNALKVSSQLYPMDLMTIQSNSIQDLDGIAILQSASPIPRKFFTPDTTPPQLLSFTMNYATNIMVLAFDEVINTTSLLPSNVMLLSAHNLSTPTLTNFTLTYYSYIIPSFTSNVIIDMDLYRYDAIALSEMSSIGQDIENIFLLVTSFQDVSGNMQNNSGVVDCSSLVVDSITFPILEAFDIVPFTSFYSVSLYFTRVINISTFACADFSLQSDGTSSPLQEVPLTGCTILSPQTSYSRIVALTLPGTFLGGTPLIGSIPSSTFLTLSSSTGITTLGISGNPVVSGRADFPDLTMFFSSFLPPFFLFLGFYLIMIASLYC